MTRRSVHRWLGVAGLVAWAVLFYRSYAGLAIPAFGPAEQAVWAVRLLTLRYLLYLAFGAAAYALAARRAHRRSPSAVRRRRSVTGHA